MKIVSFNIRYDNPEDGTNAFSFRKPLIQKALKTYAPDIIGFQEVLPHAALWLKEYFSDYYFVGHGREADFSGEQVLLAYKKKAFQLHSLYTIWLSPTPLLAGSRYENQSDCPRTCISAVFENENHFLFRVYNTHLDNFSSQARSLAVKQIIKIIIRENKKQKLPILLMGDFNSLPESKELAPLVKIFKDGTRLADFTAECGGSFHEFGKLSLPHKIDFIYGTKEFQIQAAKLWTDSKKTVFLSDHYPVEVQLQMV